MNDAQLPRDESEPLDSTVSSPELLRLDSLFRIWLREDRVHPLLHLLQRHRTESRS